MGRFPSVRIRRCSEGYTAPLEINMESSRAVQELPIAQTTEEKVPLKPTWMLGHHQKDVGKYNRCAGDRIVVYLSTCWKEYKVDVGGLCCWLPHLVQGLSGCKDKCWESMLDQWREAKCGIEDGIPLRMGKNEQNVFYWRATSGSGIVKQQGTLQMRIIYWNE